MQTNQDTHASSRPDQPTAEDTNGMTIRDYFAAKAMHALLGQGSTGTVLDPITVVPAVRVATIAYDIANAMMDERERNNGTTSS